ncbi:vanadium-dependent haloperoxidase [Pelagibacterium halotolerans]|uniref:vanadium-dependent haloperoxidase n=1 Tax=Pelagibacterium halotolerans TaxID=531813 RepID=UPI00384CCDCA
MGEWLTYIRAVRRLAAGVILACGLAGGASSALAGPAAQDVLITWNRMVLELVRHTPTYSPPVASRAFAYLGVTAFEATVGGSETLTSLAGQLNALEPVPGRETGEGYDEAVVMHTAMAHAVRHFFSNTGPTGQRAMTMLETRMGAQVAAGVPEEVVARSTAYGRAVATHIIAWSVDDGGAVVENLGFPAAFALGEGRDRWVPTSSIPLQQTPLLPEWGKNRTFAMPAGSSCPLPPPPEYSEAPGSDFYAEALEVYNVANSLDAEQEAIARFWSDDPMLSPTPPGHWLSIAIQILEHENATLDESVDLLARLGVVLADAFIGCWDAKYEFDLVRPVTYIGRLIDADWKPILITPPFPEYPSGHSTQSGAAAAVLEAHFGADFAFTDATHEGDGLPARTYASFWEAAEEAAISRLYGGIHYRAAIERGLDQGLCIADFTAALETRR